MAHARACGAWVVAAFRGGNGSCKRGRAGLQAAFRGCSGSPFPIAVGIGRWFHIRSQGRVSVPVQYPLPNVPGHIALR